MTGFRIYADDGGCAISLNLFQRGADSHKHSARKPVYGFLEQCHEGFCHERRPWHGAQRRSGSGLAAVGDPCVEPWLNRLRDSLEQPSILDNRGAHVVHRVLWFRK